MAHFWRITPEQYDACTDESKLKMIAFMESHAEMRAVEEYPIKKKLEEQRRRNKGR